MRTLRLAVALSLLLGSVHSQQPPSFYISSLEMPCYPPLARAARLQGIVKVRIEVGNDGAVTSARGVEGNQILQESATLNLKTWKFGAGQGENFSKMNTTVTFRYRLEGSPAWERCAARVMFDAFDKVEITAHPPIVTATDSTRPRTPPTQALNR